MTEETEDGAFTHEQTLQAISAPRHNIHEIGVQGSVIEQAHKFLKEEMKPELAEIELDDGTKVPIAITKGGHGVMPASAFDGWRSQPRFRDGTAKLLDLDSLIAHINRFKDTDTVVFANNARACPSITAVLDYHRIGADGDPRWGRHRSNFAFPLSDEWQAWTRHNGSSLKMVEFARFLEDHIIDVIPVDWLKLNEDQTRFVETLGGKKRIADPAKLMEVATGLQVYEDAEVSQAVKLQTGEGKMTFTSRYSDQPGGGELSVPSMFVIAIPVFVNGPLYQIITRLRFRKSGSDLIFFFELWRTDKVFDHAFTEAVEEVEAETKLPVLLGFDESLGACNTDDF